MSSIFSAGGVYPVSNGTGTTHASLGSKSASTTFKGALVLEEGIKGGLKLDGMDVGETLKLLIFFLQSRHPEVIEEFKAIRKIEQS